MRRSWETIDPMLSAAEPSFAYKCKDKSSTKTNVGATLLFVVCWITTSDNIMLMIWWRKQNRIYTPSLPIESKELFFKIIIFVYSILSKQIADI